MTMLVVFDTCTKPEYYEDVHRVLAAPPGTIVCYDYERKLWTDEAVELLGTLSKTNRKIPALLMYGQFRDYNKGDSDPTIMLRAKGAIFIPTRSAQVVKHWTIKHAESERDTIHISLELGGFLDPSTPELEGLVSELEVRQELPFDEKNAYKWISICPSNVDAMAFGQTSIENWALVVDRFASPPSQFSGDVFWRLESVEDVTNGGTRKHLKPKPRRTNKNGAEVNYNCDYSLNDLNEYVVRIRNYIPNAEANELRANATVSVEQDTSQRLILPERNIAIRRNRTSEIKVGLAPMSFLGNRYADLKIVTEIPAAEGDYPPGSSVALTLKLSKHWSNIVCTIVLGVLAAALFFTAYAWKDNLVWGGGALILGLLCGLGSNWCRTGELAPLKKI